MHPSPIKLEELAPFLNRQVLSSYIHMSLLMGFRIGYSHNHAHKRSCTNNHPSVLGNKKFVDKRIATELAEGRLLGPVPTQPYTCRQANKYLAQQWSLLSLLQHFCLTGAGLMGWHWAEQ